MDIRPATSRDMTDIAMVHRSSIEVTCAGAYTRDQIASWLSALHDDAYPMLLATHEIFVADAGGSVEGFGVYDRARSFINATYVTPTRARHGIGTALVAAMEASARASGAKAIDLHATRNAVTFYERIGYERRGDTVNRLPTGVELPCVAMTKRL